MTTITFERTGGIAGKEIDLTIDLDSLPASESRQLLQLIQDADFFDLPEDLVPDDSADEFVYTITVEGGTGGNHTVRVSDTTMPDTLRPLVNELYLLANPTSA